MLFKLQFSDGLLEDKLVQQAVVTILNQIYEEDFLGFCVLQRYTDKEVMMT